MSGEANQIVLAGRARLGDVITNNQHPQLEAPFDIVEVRTRPWNQTVRVFVNGTDEEGKRLVTAESMAPIRIGLPRERSALVIAFPHCGIEVPEFEYEIICSWLPSRQENQSQAVAV